MATRQARPSPAAGTPALDYIFHPRSVAVVGVSPQQAGFAAVGAAFLIALQEMSTPGAVGAHGRRPAIYPVNPKHQEVEGLRCYASLLEIEGPVDHVISSVPARIVPQLVDDCIAKGVKTIHFFTAGFSETGEEELAELESEVVSRAVAAGIRILGPNCMGLYVPRSGLSFMPGFPSEPGPVSFISQSGGNASEMMYTSAARGIRYAKVVSYGNAADIGESELLEYLAEDPETEIIAAYIEGLKDGRHFLSAIRKAAAAKPVVVLKGGRTEAGARAAFSHTASLAGSIQVFDGLCRQVGAVRVDSVEEMVDLTVAFRFMSAPSTSSGQAPAGPGVAVVGGGGGASVFAADEVDEAGLCCPVLPEHTQAELREFTPVAGTSVRNPVDSIVMFEPGKLGQTLRVVGRAENVDVILFHTTFGGGPWRRSGSFFGGITPEQYMDAVVDQVASARDALGKPVVLVLRPPLEMEAMERSLAFQERACRLGLPTFSTIPKAANAIAKMLWWQHQREEMVANRA